MEDPVYSAIQEISSSLPVRGLVFGQRPWSRKELARVVLTLLHARDVRSGSRGYAGIPFRASTLLDSLARRYAPDTLALTGATPQDAVEAHVRQLRFDLIGTNSLPRAVPGSNGLGSIDAITNPLVEPDWGRPIAHGGTVSVEPSVDLGLGSHLAIGLDPRLSWLQPKDSAGFEQSDFQRLYLRLTIANVALSAGADEVLWGQAGDRGTLISANARPLHAVTIANDTAFHLPWLFRYLGSARAAFSVANLGNTQNFPGAQLVSYKLSITPTDRLELGAGLMDQMGGSGSPPCSFACRAKDLFPFIFSAIKAGSLDSVPSNKVAEGEFRYHIPELRGLSWYYEADIDDFDFRRIKSSLWDQTAHMMGLSFDRLTDDGRFAFNLEGHHTPLTLYEHYWYTSGLTYRRGIIGDPVGTNAKALYATTTFRPSVGRSLGVTVSWESRDPSLFETTASDAHAAGFRFVRLSDAPRESRARVVLRMTDGSFWPGSTLYPTIAVERVTNNGFVASETRVNAMVGLEARISF